jgi:hypothetical protein
MRLQQRFHESREIQTTELNTFVYWYMITASTSKSIKKIGLFRNGVKNKYNKNKECVHHKLPVYLNYQTV